MSTEVVIDGPVGLVTKIPTILGFTPENSLVVVGTNSPHDKLMKTLVVPLIELEEKPNLVLDMIQNKLHQVCDGAVLVFYLNEGFQLQASMTKIKDEALEMYEKLQIEHDLHVRDVLWVKDNTWASFICQDILCCPEEGKKFFIEEKNMSQEIIEEVLGLVDLTINSPSFEIRDKWLAKMYEEKTDIELNTIANTLSHYLKINAERDKERADMVLGITMMLYWSAGNNAEVESLIGKQMDRTNRLAGLISRAILLDSPFNPELFNLKKKKKKRKVVQQ
jgi:hypothetical protein